jgi:hypothetical protein
MVEVVIDSVRVSLMSPQRLVVLRQVDSERYLPIWVGPYEAESITVALQEIEMIRPLTHDLLKNIITTFEGHVRRVEIVALREDIFYGNLVIESRGQMINIDARPSDAIALAVRARVPILVDASVMEAAGIIPEQDIQGQLPAQPSQAAAPASQPPAAGKPAPASPPKNDDPSRLSIFEDFLNKLDTDKPADDDKQEPEK